ncbi:hypothetical protein P4C99_03770 [Pontiellaceae bacterium B1224]|nr:hypothetical protein [Pontiellaceae bacterium B1224]
MNIEEINLHWTEFSPYISSKWPRLTGLDRETIQGKPERLMDLIQVRYNINRAEAERSIQALIEQIDR